MPVLRTRIVIDAPDSLPLKRINNLLPNAQVREARSNGRVRWTIEQGSIDEMAEMEANLPADAAAWPSVEFSSGASWESVVNAYREMIEGRIRNDDARPLLAGIRSSARGDTRKPCRAAPHSTIAKIVERLHREVRYTGIEFGSARLIPEYPSETLRRRFGDCKDKSILLVAALRARRRCLRGAAVRGRRSGRGRGTCRGSACSITPSSTCRARWAARICG